MNNEESSSEDDLALLDAARNQAGNQQEAFETEASAQQLEINDLNIILTSLEKMQVADAIPEIKLWAEDEDLPLTFNALRCKESKIIVLKIWQLVLIKTHFTEEDRDLLLKNLAFYNFFTDFIAYNEYYETELFADGDNLIYLLFKQKYHLIEDILKLVLINQNLERLDSLYSEIFDKSGKTLAAQIIDCDEHRLRIAARKTASKSKIEEAASDLLRVSNNLECTKSLFENTEQSLVFCLRFCIPIKIKILASLFEHFTQKLKKLKISSEDKMITEAMRLLLNANIEDPDIQTAIEAFLEMTLIIAQQCKLKHSRPEVSIMLYANFKIKFGNIELTAKANEILDKIKQAMREDPATSNFLYSQERTDPQAQLKRLRPGLS